eukprot:jgi/Phyca11/106384/e_gw1.12.453.1
MDTLTWQLLYGASRGLLHLHEQHSIVHGGLRCNNILVDKKGRAVIADFGLYTESLRSLSDTGSLASSTSSASASSFATDVYAFGMCILEALTRTVPW